MYGLASRLHLVASAPALPHPQPTLTIQHHHCLNPPPLPSLGTFCPVPGWHREALSRNYRLTGNRKITHFHPGSPSRPCQHPTEGSQALGLHFSTRNYLEAILSSLTWQGCALCLTLRSPLLWTHSGNGAGISEGWLGSLPTSPGSTVTPAAAPPFPWDPQN